MNDQESALRALMRADARVASGVARQQKVEGLHNDEAFEIVCAVHRRNTSRNDRAAFKTNIMLALKMESKR